MSLRKQASIARTLLGGGIGAGTGALAAGEDNRGKGAIIGGLLGTGLTHKAFTGINKAQKDLNLAADIESIPLAKRMQLIADAGAEDLDSANKVVREYASKAPASQEDIQKAIANSPSLTGIQKGIDNARLGSPLAGGVIGGGAGGLGTRMFSKKKDGEQNKEASVFQLSELASMVEQGYFGKEAQYAFEGMTQAIESYVQEDLTEKSASFVETDYNIYDENAARVARLNNLLRK